MKYPFIPVMPLVAEAMSEVKTILKTLSITEEDCYIWAVDAVRQIGGDIYEKNGVYLTVNKYNAKLPGDFYLLDNMWYCDPAALAYTHRELGPDEEPMRWVKSNIIAPADSTTLRHCVRSPFHRADPKAKLSYTLKLPPGVARFSFHTGKVFIDYVALVQDAQGLVMVPDEVNCGLAVKNYIQKKIIYEPFLMGEVAAGVYDRVDRAFDDYLGLAQQQMKFPNHADTRYEAIKQDQKYRQFSYKRQ